MASAKGKDHQTTPQDPRAVVLQMAVMADLEGRVHEAIAAYQEAVNLGYRGADVWYRLGKLLRDSHRFAEAVPFLEHAVSSDTYALSSRFFLGECTRELGDQRRAVSIFERVLVDLDLHLARREDVDQLIDMCDEIAVTFQAQGELGMAATLYQRLARWLQTKRWLREVAVELAGAAEELGRRSIAQKLRHIGSGEVVEFEPIAVVGGRSSGPRLLSRLPAFLDAPLPVLPDAPVQPGMAQGASRRSMGGLLRPLGALFRNTGGEGGEPARDGVPAGEWMGAPAAVEARAETPRIAAEPPRVPSPAATVDEQPALEPQVSVQDLLDEGTEYLRRGLYYAAVEACFDVVARSPGFLPAHLRLGEANLRRGRTAEAVSKYQTVIEVCEVRGKPEEAIGAYQLLLQAEPSNVKERIRLANLLAERGQSEEAAEQRVFIAELHLDAGLRAKGLEEFARAERLAPAAAHLYVRFARALERHGDRERSLALLREVLKFDPRNVDALCAECIAAARADEGRFWDTLSHLLDAVQDAEARQVEAVYQLQRATESGGSPLLSFALGVLQARREDLMAAAQQLEQVLAGLAVQPVPGGNHAALQIASRYLLGKLYLGQSRPRQAVEILEECLVGMSGGADAPADGAVALLPRQQQVEELLVEAHLRLGNVNKAAEVLSDLKRRAPGDAHLYTRLAELYFRQGQLTAALKELEDLAGLYLRTDEANKAMEVVRQMTVLAPRSVAVRKKLVEMFHERGMVTEELNELGVLSEVQKARGFVTESARTLGMAAHFSLTVGKADDAVRFIERMVATAPNDATTRQEAVTLYLQLSMLDAAVEQQRAVAEICLRKGNVHEGIAAVRQVLGLAPHDDTILKQLGDTLRALGQFGEAAKLYARLAAQHPEDEEWVALRALMEREAAEHGGDHERG